MIDFLLSQLNGFSWGEWLLIVVSFCASFLTIIAGIGGGVLLLASMLSVFPPLVVLPVHAVVQMGSNFFRAILMRHFLSFDIFIPFTIGAVIGAVIGSQIVVTLSNEYLKFILAMFILYLVWGPKLKKLSFVSLKVSSFVGGVLSTLASLFVGAGGPLAAAFIRRKSQKKETYVATHASSMMIQHTLKIFVFGFIGFSYYEYTLLIILMIISGFLGTYLGRHVFLKLPERIFDVIYKTMITLMALKLLYDVFI